MMMKNSNNNQQLYRLQNRTEKLQFIFIFNVDFLIPVKPEKNNFLLKYKH